MTSTPILRAATPTLPASSSAVRRSLQRGARAFHWKPTPSVPRFHFHLNATVTQTLNPRRPRGDLEAQRSVSAAPPARTMRKGSRVSSVRTFIKVFSARKGVRLPLFASSEILEYIVCSARTRISQALGAALPEPGLKLCCQSAFSVYNC